MGATSTADFKPVAIVLALVASPLAAWAQDPRVDLRLRSEIVATVPLGADVDEADLDLDSRIDAGFSGLLRPELSGRVSVRDRRDLNEPPEGSALRDSWDLRDGRDQERLEQAWLEFGDRLALRAGRQLDWAGFPVRYDGASVRLRRLATPIDAFAFAGLRARLDAVDRDDDTLDPVFGGRLEMQFGQSTITLGSLTSDVHLLDVGFVRRLGRRRFLDAASLAVGYSQLGLRSHGVRAGVDVSLRRIPLRVSVSGDARLLRSEDDLVFDYTTSVSNDATKDVRLHLEPPPPNVLMSVRAHVHPLPMLAVSMTVSRRQLFSPSETTAWNFSFNEIAARLDVLDDRRGTYGSLEGSIWLPDPGDPPQDASATTTQGEGERRSMRLSGALGARGERLAASLNAGVRRFDYVSPKARIEGVRSATITAESSLRIFGRVEATLWAAYDQALPILDHGIEAVLAGGLRLEARIR